MRDLKKSLTSNLRYTQSSKNEYVNNSKFNQIFVIRDCPNSKSDIDKLFDRQTQGFELKFVCLYDYSYAVLKITNDQNGHLDSKIELISNYILSNKSSKAQENDEQEQER